MEFNKDRICLEWLQEKFPGFYNLECYEVLLEHCLNNQKVRVGMKRSLEELSPEEEDTEIRKDVDECKENGLSS